MNGQEVICFLTVKCINGSYVSFTTPNGCGVDFCIKDSEKYQIGQQVFAIGVNTHLISAGCHYRLVPFWDGK
jgi:hypothetical protein